MNIGLITHDVVITINESLTQYTGDRANYDLISLSGLRKTISKHLARYATSQW